MVNIPQAICQKQNKHNTAITENITHSVRCEIKKKVLQPGIEPMSHGHDFIFYKSSCLYYTAPTHHQTNGELLYSTRTIQ